MSFHGDKEKPNTKVFALGTNLSKISLALFRAPSNFHRETGLYMVTRIRARLSMNAYLMLVVHARLLFT